MIILGIDPGTRLTGFGVIEKVGGGKLRGVTWGTIHTNPLEETAANLNEIARRFSLLLKDHRPELVVIEKLFAFKNVKTVITVAEARGVLLLEAGRHGVRLKEFTPLEVKRIVTGDGRADKKQVQKMVQLILNLSRAPTPDDAADALALAICGVLHEGGMKNYG